MAKGAVHPNGTNFIRVRKLDIVERMRILVKQKVYNRPPWLTWVERVPPLELQNLKRKDRKVFNIYHKLIKFILKKYGDLRFQDAFVFGNDHSKGNDSYRDDHPVMQFVAKQLRYMNNGYDIKSAFTLTERDFLGKRMEIEKEIKILMCLARATDVERNGVDEDQIKPIFTTGHAYLYTKMADLEYCHLQRIHNAIREMHLKKRHCDNMKVDDKNTKDLLRDIANVGKLCTNCDSFKK